MKRRGRRGVRPGSRGVFTRALVDAVLHYCTLNSTEADDWYQAILDDAWAWTPETEPYRTAVLQALRTVAEAEITPALVRQIHRLTPHVTCPDCKRHDFTAELTGMLECSCGTRWRAAYVTA